MVPLRGIENAKFIMGPNAVPVKSILPPTSDIPVAELPNRTKLVVPTNPPAIVVRITIPPEANCIIALLPVAPVPPFGPVLPVVSDGYSHS